MVAAIIGFLTALFNNGGGLLKQIVALARGNPETKKEQVEQDTRSEEQRRDQGGRPG